MDGVESAKNDGFRATNLRFALDCDFAIDVSRTLPRQASPSRSHPATSGRERAGGGAGPRPWRCRPSRKPLAAGPGPNGSFDESAPVDDDSEVRRGEPPVEPNTLPTSLRAWKPRTLRSFLYFGGPWSRTSRDAASSACSARKTRDKKEQNASENHDHVGRGPVRRNAPPSAPSRYLRPTLLQHEWLHQLPRRRPGDGSCPLRDLRLHAPASLSARGRTGRIP